MTTASKLAVRRVHTGDFKVDQQQRLAQQAAQKSNTHAEMLGALLNRSYTALAADITLATSASYATLLTANITTLLNSGYLIITWTASGDQITGAGTAFFTVVVDGVTIKGLYNTIPLNFSWNSAMVIRVPVTRGSHVVLLKWKTNVSSVRIRPVTTVENHATMLVQEAA